jgi:hypothetical protein
MVTPLYICEVSYFDVLSNVSFSEHLPEDAHSRWPKRIGAYDAYTTVNLHISM